MKTLDEFDFVRNPKVSAQQIHELARGDYIAKAEPVIFIGDSGTGKTHLLTGLAVAACRQKRRVRFATAAGLINEMVEAKHQLQLGRALSRWARYDLIALDEVGYVPLAEVGAELLFQVIAERAEKAAVIVTTNLPFSEWTSVVPNARLCKALIDRSLTARISSRRERSPTASGGRWTSVRAKPWRLRLNTAPPPRKIKRKGITLERC
jgi:DNA replication protein DnaC